ncbi:TetR/AcrR family transcriptional regulator; helix-turn-helix transcriptional regulator [Actinocorallia sp. API 0066]|uniref:TetR/AcrR family transcriptional regulator n=1 Tax=Actinocorallia sp. API 0066 TaxID=2896846 RepID=UPI001E371A66|nr:TetR/AcrR family transcriptional regulator [Actinocorallia sp. API 0066]MCD0451435.1 TetR/AcrR family transcriptional regulator; helix-turn-helix transcriptional regulator [Actinocorallia sp. API 0066]
MKAEQQQRAGALPPAPDPALDPYLDAAARCFTRFGVGRTSVQDIARELGVNRTTVYRQVGNVRSAALLLVSREVDRILATLPGRIAGLDGPEAVVELLATVIEESLAHPVLQKMLTDERDMIGSLLAGEIPRLFTEITDRIAPLLRLLAGGGAIADRDPVVVAEWLTRIAVTVMVAEPRGPLRRFLAELLVPALRPYER